MFPTCQVGFVRLYVSPSPSPSHDSAIVIVIGRVSSFPFPSCQNFNLIFQFGKSGFNVCVAVRGTWGCCFMANIAQICFQVCDPCCSDILPLIDFISPSTVSMRTDTLEFKVLTCAWSGWTLSWISERTTRAIASTERRSTSLVSSCVVVSLCTRFASTLFSFPSIFMQWQCESLVFCGPVRSHACHAVEKRHKDEQKSTK